MNMSAKATLSLLSAAILLALLQACGSSRTTEGDGEGDADGLETDSGDMSTDGIDALPDPAGDAGDPGDADLPDGEGVCPEGTEPCGAGCCTAEETCAYEVCVPTSAVCSTDDDCGNDTWCDPATGLCIPYGSGPRGETNPDCTHTVTVARFSPLLQCSFEQAPAGDPYPLHVHVLSTPMVVDFDFDENPDVIRPSIVATFDDGVDGSSEQPTGLIRILDGRTCALQFNLDMHMTSHSSPPALGDLDLDGTPDVVANAAGGGLVAFTYHKDRNLWEILWESHNADGSPYTAAGGGWSGPSIHDLDDDGSPEVLRGGVILDAAGQLMGGSLGYRVYSAGIFPVVADVDLDGGMELVTGTMIYGFDPASSDWTPETYFSGAGLTDGHTAVGDFGDFPMTALDAADKPEVVVISSAHVRVQTLEGGVIFPTTLLPGSPADSGCGGPPTIADFDGDGRAEFAVAGRGSYTVFDFDCLPGGDPAGCATGGTGGVLWTKTSQDYSSCVTGSSVFDFEGDGHAEAIYADECFVRVYQGASGDVIYSQYRSSCTWYENPIVADADGDFNSELIVPSNKNCAPPTDPENGRPCEGLDPGNLDPHFPGLRCLVPEDCASGVCDAGFCRCAVDDDCCLGGCGGTGFVCATPTSTTPGTGNVCRAAHPHGTAGIRVYMDAADRWVDSRPIWNQHAYHVTHVEDSGAIIRTSAVQPNWTTPGLNNFRQNVMGDLEHLSDPDLTSGGGSFNPNCSSTGGTLTLEVLVCNRGSQPVDSGLEVAFWNGDPEEGGTLICTEDTGVPLAPGECAPVSCPWENPPRSLEAAVDVWVVSDNGEEASECFEGNNWSVIPDVYCEVMG